MMMMMMLGRMKIVVEGGEKRIGGIGEHRGEVVSVVVFSADAEERIRDDADDAGGMGRRCGVGKGVGVALFPALG